MTRKKSSINGLIQKEGFNILFDPTACRQCPGRCCNGKSGNIFLTRDEIEVISRFLNMEIPEFRKTYIRRTSSGFSIREVKEGDNYACIFFDPLKNLCNVYPVRPDQCRTFPFWDYFKDKPGELSAECPGVSFF